MTHTTRRLELDGVRRHRTWPNKKAKDAYLRKLAEDRQKLDAGMMVTQGAITYAALVELFFANRPTKKSDGWLRQMLAHSEARFGGLPVRAIRAEEVGVWLHTLPRSAKTKTHILSSFRQVLDAGIEWGYLERNPARTRAVESPGTKRKRPIRPFESWLEVCEVAYHAGQHRLDTAEVSEGMIRFACATGLRVPSELLAITPAHVDKSTMPWTLHVPGTKTSNAERWIPLALPARDALELIPWPIDKSAPLFPIDYEQWRGVWKKALSLACVQDRTPYEMRHTFATLALEARMPIESLTPLMGHANFQTTLKHYAKFTRRRLDHDISLLDVLEFNPKRKEEAQ